MVARKKLNRWKKIALILLFLAAAFWTYVEIANRNSKNMNARQKVLKAIYPLWMGWNRLTGKRADVLEYSNSVPANSSFYSLSATLNDGSTLQFETLKGKKVLLVNTASDCGYTNQYEDLQKLYEQYAGQLMVIAFPANDFKEQEKGSDEEIAAFCKMNFGVSFPLAKKSSVVKSPGQHEVFQWLTDKVKNGWNEKPPSWNFSKYLINERGQLTHYFDPAVSPLSDEVKKAIQ
jgi:glutathione peroxidase